MIISLTPPPPTPHKKYFWSCPCGPSNVPATSCVWAFFVSVVLVVPQPNSICILNWLTSCSIQFNSCSYVSLPGDMTSIFSHSELPATTFWPLFATPNGTALCCYARDHIATLFFFNPMCLCGHQIHQQPVVHVPLCLRCWLCHSQLAFAF